MAVRPLLAALALALSSLSLAAPALAQQEAEAVFTTPAEPEMAEQAAEQPAPTVTPAATVPGDAMGDRLELLGRCMATGEAAQAILDGIKAQHAAPGAEPLPAQFAELDNALRVLGTLVRDERTRLLAELFRANGAVTLAGWTQRHLTGLSAGQRDATALLAAQGAERALLLLMPGVWDCAVKASRPE